MSEKTSVVKYEETVVPRYIFEEVRKEIPVFKEVPIEAVNKPDVTALISEIRAGLEDLNKRIKNLTNYRIEEQAVQVKVPVFKDVMVEKPVYLDRTVLNPIIQDVKIQRPIWEEIKVPRLTEKDIENLTAYYHLAEDILSRLKQIKNYKIQEDIVKHEQHIVVPVKKEIPVEKVVFHVKDEIIETLEDLLKTLKKK